MSKLQLSTQQPRRNLVHADARIFVCIQCLTANLHKATP